MGILSDIVIAGTDDAKAVCQDVSPDNRSFVWKEMIGMSVEMLAALQCVLERQRFTRKIWMEVVDEYSLLCEEGGTIVVKVPDQLVACLSKMQRRELANLAGRWRDTDCPAMPLAPYVRWDRVRRKSEIYTIESFSEEVLETYLHILRTFSIQAIRRKKSLLLRLST